MVSVVLLAEGEPDVPGAVRVISWVDERDLSHEVFHVDSGGLHRRCTDLRLQHTGFGTGQRIFALSRLYDPIQGRRVELDRRRLGAFDVDASQRPDLETVIRRGGRPGGVRVEESSADEDVASLGATGEVELAHQPLVEGEVAGVATRQHLDDV